MEKNKKKLICNIIEIALIAAVVVFVLCATLIQIIKPESKFGIWCIENVWDVKNTFASLKNHLPILIDSLIYICIIYAICKIIRVIFSSKMKQNDRKKTIYTLLDGFVKYGCAIAIIFFILKAVGVNTGALIASVGVLTLVVGLGANALIADIIAGIFIIFEDEYHVGEIVTINDFRGEVMEIGIRSTKLIDAAGNIKIINNSAIGDVINLSREISLAVVDCDFPYDVPVELVEKILKDNFDDVSKNIPAIVEGPYYKGVCMYKDSNVTIKIVAKCNEADRFQVERDLNREYRRLLRENNIDIAFPQVVINYPQSKDYKLTSRDKREATEFANEQKELSQNMEEQHS